jgi:hypothetical protein
MKTFTITKKNFLEWYFNTGADGDQKDMRTNLGKEAVKSLFKRGWYSISVDTIFNNDAEHECIPLMYLEEFPDDADDELADLDYEWEVKLIN